MSKKFSLMGIRIDECSLVDKGANPGARVLLFKRDAEGTKGGIIPEGQRGGAMTVNINAAGLAESVRKAIFENIDKLKKLWRQDTDVEKKLAERIAASKTTLEKVGHPVKQGGAAPDTTIEKFASSLADLHKCCGEVANIAPSYVHQQVASTFDELMERREVQQSAEEFRTLVYALQDSMTSIVNDQETPEDVKRDLLLRSLNEFKAAVEEEIAEQGEAELYMTKSAAQIAIARSRVALNRI